MMDKIRTEEDTRRSGQSAASGQSASIASSSFPSSTKCSNEDDPPPPTPVRGSDRPMKSRTPSQRLAEKMKKDVASRSAASTANADSRQYVSSTAAGQLDTMNRKAEFARPEVSMDVSEPIPLHSLCSDASFKEDEKKKKAGASPFKKENNRSASRPEEVRMFALESKAKQDGADAKREADQDKNKNQDGADAKREADQDSKTKARWRRRHERSRPRQEQGLASSGEGEYDRSGGQSDEAAAEAESIRPGIVAVPGPGANPSSRAEDGSSGAAAAAVGGESAPSIQAYAVTDEAFQSEAHDIVRQMMDDAVVVEAEQVVNPQHADDENKKSRCFVASLIGCALAVVVVVMTALGVTGTLGGSGDDDMSKLDTSPSCDEKGNCWIPRSHFSRPAADLGEIYDEFGEEVSLAKDGMRLAVSARMCNVILLGNGVRCAPEGSEGEADAGVVWVYDVNSDGSIEEENPIGEFFGIEGDETMGFLSGDGNHISVMARFRRGVNDTDDSKDVGITSFYEYTAPGTWEQLGSPIRGKFEKDKAGKDTSLSQDGKVVVISSPSSDKEMNGTVRIYGYKVDSSGWTQVGTDLIGENAGDQFGWSTAISKEGNVVAVGARRNDGGLGEGKEAGHVRVFRLMSGEWVQLGTDIDALAEKDKFGGKIDLSADGMTLAAGAWDHDGKNGDDSGQVRVFEYDSENNVWNQVGKSINGDGVDDRVGQVSISSDGKRLAVGATGSLKGETGYTKVYENIKGDWQQLGGTLTTDRAGDNLGMSVSLSGDGTRLVVGAPARASHEIRSGYVRIYDLQVQLPR